MTGEGSVAVALRCVVLGVVFGAVAPSSWAADCPEGTRPTAEGTCIRDATEIEFEGLDVDGEVIRPSLQYVTERSTTTKYPCDDLRQPGLIDEWETCLVNYYGTSEVPRLSNELAARFVESRACPQDDKDIDLLDQIVRTYSRHPKTEDLSELRTYPVYPNSSVLEPQLPLMCGYNVSQRRWYPPRNFYCDAEACYPQTDSGPKDRVRYAPIPNGRGLMEVRSNDPSIRSIADGGGYGHLRVIPLGNRVYLATSGGMYGDVYYYGLIIVPDEEQYLARACDMQERSERSGLIGRLIYRLRAQTLLQQAEALVEQKRVTARLAELATGLVRIEQAQLQTRAEQLMEVLIGARPGVRVDVPACARYESKYPRAYQKRVQARSLEETIGAAAGSAGGR